MLSKKQRLNLTFKKNQSIFQQKRHYSQNFIYYFSFAGKEFKAAAVVPKKKIGLAVDRNKIKRLIYQSVQSFTQQHPSFQIKIIIVLKNKIDIRTASKETLQQLQNEIKETLEKLYQLQSTTDA